MSSLDLSSKIFVGKILKLTKYWLLGLVFVQVFWAIDISLRPYIMKVLIDRLVHYQSNTSLINPALFYMFISVLVIFVFRFYDFIYLNLSPLLKKFIGDILLERMMQQPLTLFHDNFSGSLANKIKDVMSGVPDLIKIIDSQMAVTLGMLVATYTMWKINYQFAILFILWLGIYALIIYMFLDKAKKLSIKQAEIRSQTVGQMVDILSNILNVKLFANRLTESNRFRGYLDKYASAEKKRDWCFFWMSAAQGISFVAYQAGCFFLLLYWFKAGIVTAGDFALLIMLNVSIINELWSLSKTILLAADIYGNIVQGLRIVLRPITLHDKPNAKELIVSGGNIEFDKISFQYHDVAPIFTDKSLKISAGQKVGLIGYSGGGKTTFVNLILRLYEPKSGHIWIDGQDIQKVTQDSLHRNIAMIPQDPTLFHRSIMENIRYGCKDASDEEVIHAAKKANAHDFINQLPHKYDSLVGERGVKLSGGQRQRIAIARAILKNAPILILDEATSQLDSVSEKQIQNSLWQAMTDKTVIIIAHRLSTLLSMDRILVFDEGRIVQDGNHAKLIKQSGKYKTLWDTQVGGFIAY